VKDYLIKTRSLAEEQMAIKTSQLDELKEVDEIGGLLSRDCPIRYIIRKQALQERNASRRDYSAQGWKHGRNDQLRIAPQLVFAGERNVQTCATIQR
jgi:hypothetical protein